MADVTTPAEPLYETLERLADAGEKAVAFFASWDVEHGNFTEPERDEAETALSDFNAAGYACEQAGIAAARAYALALRALEERSRAWHTMMKLGNQIGHKGRWEDCAHKDCAQDRAMVWGTEKAPA